MDRSLAKIPLFRSIPQTGLRSLEAKCGWRDYAAGQWIIDHEAGGDEVYFVQRGHLRVSAAVAGRDTILRDLHDGDFFGELAAIDGRPRSAGILAVTNATVALMPAATFRKVLHEYSDVCDQILAVLVGQIRMLSNRAYESAGLDVRHRLWAELLRLARSGRMGDGGMTLSPPPTHAELAARIGSHREAITRELNAMERSGLIERRRNAIELRDPERIRGMVAEATEA
jgi:CRP-like cAMP-binding protein